MGPEPPGVRSFSSRPGPWAEDLGASRSRRWKQVRLDESSTGGRDRRSTRACSVVQRLGEMQIFEEEFEALNGKRWALIGDPELVNDLKFAGEHSLRVPGGTSASPSLLDEPVAAGRLELAYYDKGGGGGGGGGAIEHDQQCFVDLLFRSVTDPKTVRVVLRLVGRESLQSSRPRASPHSPSSASLAKRAGIVCASRFEPRTDRDLG